MRLVEVEILDEEVKFVYLNRGKGLICKKFDDVKDTFDRYSYIINLDKTELGETACIYFSKDIDSQEAVDCITSKFERYLAHNRKVTAARNRLLGFDISMDEILKEIRGQRLNYYTSQPENSDVECFVFNRWLVNDDDMIRINKETLLSIRETGMTELSQLPDFYTINRNIGVGFTSCYKTFIMLKAYITAKYSIKPEDYIIVDVTPRVIGAVLVRDGKIIDYYIGYDIMKDKVGVLDLASRDKKKRNGEIMYSFKIHYSDIIEW